MRDLWPEMPLRELADLQDERRVPVRAADRVPGPYPYCGANGVVDHVDDYRYEGSFILVAEDGGYWGPNEPSAYRMSGKFWVNNHAHVLVAKPGIVQQFLLHSLNNMDLRPWITGTTRGKMNASALKSIPIRVPSVEEQKRIADLLDSLDEDIVARVEHIRDAKSLRTALASSLLSGAHTIPQSYDRFLSEIEQPSEPDLVTP